MKLGRQKNDDWRKLGESLQGDYIHNQKRFWASIRSTVKCNREMERICDDNGQVLCEEEEVRMRWKDYFATLLESDQNNNAQVPDHRKGLSEGEDADQETECTV